YLKVGLGGALATDARNRGGRGPSTPPPYRNPPPRPRLRRSHAIELELHPSFAHLRVECREPCFGRAERVVGLVEFLTADGTGLDQRLKPFDLRSPIIDVGLRPGAVGLGAEHGRPLAFF